MKDERWKMEGTYFSVIGKFFRRLGTLARPPACLLARSGKSAQATFPRELGLSFELSIG